MIFLNMSQNRRHRLLPLPHSESVLLKQAPPLPVDVVVPVSSVELTWQAIDSCLVWCSIRGDYVRGGKGGYSRRVLCTIECRTIPLSKYLMVIVFVLLWNHYKATHFSCAAFSLLLFLSFFVSRLQTSRHCKWSSYMARALNCPILSVWFHT